MLVKRGPHHSKKAHQGQREVTPYPRSVKTSSWGGDIPSLTPLSAGERFLTTPRDFFSYLGVLGGGERPTDTRGCLSGVNDKTVNNISHGGRIGGVDTAR